jgi:hypothetical protein
MSYGTPAGFLKGSPDAGPQHELAESHFAVRIMESLRHYILLAILRIVWCVLYVPP